MTRRRPGWEEKADTLRARYPKHKGDWVIETYYAIWSPPYTSCGPVKWHLYEQQGRTLEYVMEKTRSVSHAPRRLRNRKTKQIIMVPNPGWP